MCILTSQTHKQLFIHTSKMSTATNLPPFTHATLGQFFLHLYTPYGVAIVAVIAIILTSVAWGVGCCIYCCCRWRHRERQSGELEADRELAYYGMGSSDNLAYTSSALHGGTLSSGYNTGPPVSTCSLAQLDTSYNTHTTSMDSILGPSS